MMECLVKLWHMLSDGKPVSQGVGFVERLGNLTSKHWKSKHVNEKGI